MIDKLNGNLLKWIVVSLVPATLAVGAWAGALQNEIKNVKKTAAQAVSDERRRGVGFV